jgi:hypothetical protein
LYIRIFDLLVNHNDLYDEIENNNYDKQGHMNILGVLLCYFELNLSNLKENNFKENQLVDYEHLKLDDKKLILKIKELNTHVYQLKINDSSCNELQLMLIRGFCLQLFININYFSNEKESKIIQEFINSELDNIENHYVEVANSKILKFINNETILTLYMKKEELKIFKTKNIVRNFFTEKNYQEIIDTLEPWISRYKLVINKKKL